MFPNYTPFVARSIYIYAVVGVGVVISNFHQMSLSTISSDVAASLQADSAMLALLVSAFTYTFAFMQIPAGILADTLGPRKSVTIALVLTAFGTFLFGIADGVPMVIAARICLGIGTSVILIPLMKIIAVWFPPRWYGTLVAMAMALCSIGFFMATSPMALATSVVGWRSTYIALSIFTGGWAFLIWFLVKDSPAGKQSHAESPPPNLPWVKTALKTVLMNKQSWILGFWMFFQVGIYFAFIGLWAGQLLIGGMGFSIGGAGEILTLPACILMVSPLVTWIGEHAPSRRGVLICLSLLTVVLSIPLFLGLPRLSPVMMTGYFFIFSLPAMGGLPIVYTMAKELFPIKYAGIVSGFVNSLPFFGAALLQQAIGFSAEILIENGASVYDALSTSFILLTGAGAASVILALLIQEPTKPPIQA